MKATREESAVINEFDMSVVLMAREILRLRSSSALAELMGEKPTKI